MSKKTNNNNDDFGSWLFFRVLLQSFSDIETYINTPKSVKTKKNAKSACDFLKYIVKSNTNLVNTRNIICKFLPF